MTVVTIRLPEGDVLLDGADALSLAGRTIYIGSNGYPHFSTEQTGPVTVHSFVMGGTRPRQQIDHINGNKLDCRRANLRFTTHQVNQANRKGLSPKNTSGARGVIYRPGVASPRPWMAQITVLRRCIYLGSFATKEEAVAARRAAELEHYGEVCP